MTRATDETFDFLHLLTAESIIAEIKAYRAGERLDKDNRVMALPPALVAQALKFLKDNGIDAPARAAKLRDELAGSLPSFEDVEAAHGAPN